MIAKLFCEPAAAKALAAKTGIALTDGPVESVEVEFRELPYFIVSRSREQWTEARGDINAIKVIGASDFGLLTDPDSTPAGDTTSPRRTTLIPWTNIISLTLTQRPTA